MRGCVTGGGSNSNVVGVCVEQKLLYIVLCSDN